MIIKINESQKKRLFEAYSNDFSFKRLSAFGDCYPDDIDIQYEYCKRYLGKPIGIGGSRATFQLTDNYVLKLAMEYNGFAQNEREYSFYELVDSDLIAKILYRDKNYSFLISEFVLPAKPEDFEKYVGIPYYSKYAQKTEKRRDEKSKNGGDITIGFDKYFKGDVPNNNVSDICIDNILWDMVSKTNIYNEIIENNWWLKRIKELVNKYKLVDLTIGNFGIVNRNGKPLIVVLDSGINYARDDYEFEMEDM